MFRLRLSNQLNLLQVEVDFSRSYHFHLFLECKGNKLYHQLLNFQVFHLYSTTIEESQDQFLTDLLEQEQEDPKVQSLDYKLLKFHPMDCLEDLQ